MRIAVAKPNVKRNNTAFQAQAQLWEFIAQEHGCQVSIFSDARLKYQNGRLQVRPVRKIGERPWFPPYPGLLPGLRGYDVVVTADPSLYAYAHWAALAALTWKAKLVLDTSVTLSIPAPHSLRKRVILGLAKAIFAFAHRVIVTTPLTAQRFSRLGLLSEASAKVVELGHPVDTDLFCPGETISDRPHLNILSVGRLDYAKGHHVTIRSLAPILRENKARLLIAGQGPYRERLAQLCRDCGVADQVSFLGLVPREELPALYRECDIFIHHPLTTRQWEEFFGVALAEAMSCGLPVVASDCGAIRHVVPQGAGFIVAQGDVEALRQKVNLLRKSPGLRAEMGAAGRAYVLRRYSVREVARKCYEEVLS